MPSVSSNANSPVSIPLTAQYANEPLTASISDADIVNTRLYAPPLAFGKTFDDIK